MPDFEAVEDCSLREYWFALANLLAGDENHVKLWSSAGIVLTCSIALPHLKPDLRLFRRGIVDVLVQLDTLSCPRFISYLSPKAIKSGWRNMQRYPEEAIISFSYTGIFAHVSNVH
ncbi:predicted protein [Sclerotinia sclerotiorum 1980 UF-70]|uniref:Uncharacterized protein n=1 Tax=Sclerotinia sclerotiorum (strain ATCC 18683 / 1980 / Ss-1) TaxID=665079 RepID=A7ESW2_SCLS1|nr:predicted protein [Sclerotinia sclerotiorum 1980 UF-70]EDN92554.1 predicted protein [Sclerotinia sclerotiorum 1980 UF-70]